MDFWASLEHKIYYKYERAVPEALLDELRQAADATSRLDLKMENLHDEVRQLNRKSSAGEIEINNMQRIGIPDEFMEAFCSPFGG